MRMVVETMGGTADYLASHGYDGPALRAGGHPGRNHREGSDQPSRRTACGTLPRGRGRGGGGHAMTTWLAITRTDVADYINTLVLVYLVLIFIRSSPAGSRGCPTTATSRRS